jgi:hypothetical protein
MPTMLCYKLVAWANRLVSHATSRSVPPMGLLTMLPLTLKFYDKSWIFSTSFWHSRTALSINNNVRKKKAVLHLMSERTWSERAWAWYGWSKWACTPATDLCGFGLGQSGFSSTQMTRSTKWLHLFHPQRKAPLSLAWISEGNALSCGMLNSTAPLDANSTPRPVHTPLRTHSFLCFSYIPMYLLTISKFIYNIYCHSYTAVHLGCI